MELYFRRSIWWGRRGPGWEPLRAGEGGQGSGLRLLGSRNGEKECGYPLEGETKGAEWVCGAKRREAPQWRSGCGPASEGLRRGPGLRPLLQPWSARTWALRTSR